MESSKENILLEQIECMEPALREFHYLIKEHGLSEGEFANDMLHRMFLTLSHTLDDRKAKLKEEAKELGGISIKVSGDTEPADLVHRSAILHLIDKIL